MKQARFVLVVLLSVWQIGCATSSGRRFGPYIDEQWKQIHSIALVDPQGPARITIADPNPAIWGGAVGEYIGGVIGVVPMLIGIGIAESNMKHWSSEFETQKGTNSIDVPKELADVMRATLQQSGYLPQVIGRPSRDKLGLLPMADFSHMEGSDAYLDCVVQEYGYIHVSTEKGGSNYVPRVIVSVQLVSPREQQVLLARSFVSTTGAVPLKTMGIGGRYKFFSTAEERFRYKTADEVIANPENAIAGIRSGISNVCASICKTLVAHTSQSPKLYVFNETSTFADANSASVQFAVDEQVFFLKGDDYLAVPVSIGDHAVRDPNRSEHHKRTSSKHQKTVDLHVEEGQSYYLKVSGDMGAVKLKLMGKVAGEAALARITHKFELRSVAPKDDPASPDKELKKGP